jgi:hypothetical protein
MQLSADEEHKKRCLYRQWYGDRNKSTTLDRRKTYNDLFQKKYGETMDEYHARLAANANHGHKATKDFYMKAGR